MGAAAAAANLLYEFNIAEKKDPKHTNIKNGNVILVRIVANSILLLSCTNPGAIKPTKVGMNISITSTINRRPRNNKLKISFANLVDLDLFFMSSEVKLGTNAALKVPSANSRLKVFGILKATKNTSAKKLVPRKIAIKISLIYPRILLIIV